MKLLGVGLLVLFVGFWMTQSPDSLAQFTKDGVGALWDTTSTVFSSLIDFLDSLFR